MSDKKKKNSLITHSTKDIKINFPKPKQAIEKEARKIQNGIQEGSIYLPNGQTFINKKTIPNILATDVKGANIVYNDLEDEDKLEDGNNKYISTPALNKELSKRIEEPRDTIKKEILKYSETSINALRDAPEIENLRELEESKIRKELPSVKRKKIKTARVDEITKEPLTNPEVHHKNRISDKPREALEDENMAVINKETHRTGENSLHKNNIETKEEYEKFKKRKEKKS